MRRLLLLPFLALPLLVSGCSGDDGSAPAPAPPGPTAVVDRPADQLLSEARAVLNRAQTVRLRGSVTQPAAAVQLDLAVKGSAGGTGTVTIGGTTFDVVRIGDDIYLRTGAAFYAAQPNPAAAGVLADKWIKASASTPNFAEFTSLTDVGKLAVDLLTADGEVSKGAVQTIDGVQALELRSAGPSGRVVFVATADGRPVRVTSAGESTGTVDLADYDLPVDLIVPSPVVDPATVPR